jgi:RNA polymerase sigma-70 factor, ECF subfamily
VLRIVRAHRPSGAEEQDLAQNVFLKMFSGLSTYDERLPFENWLARVAVHACLDACRSARRRPELRWSDLSETSAEVLQATLEDRRITHPAAPLAARELLARLLDALNAEDRLVLRLLVGEEKSVAEIRALTGWSASLVKVRAFRARQKLKRVMARLEKEPR